MQHAQRSPAPMVAGVADEGTVVPPWRGWRRLPCWAGLPPPSRPSLPPPLGLGSTPPALPPLPFPQKVSQQCFQPHASLVCKNLALAIKETVAGHGLGALEVPPPPPSNGRLEVHCRALWARRLARPGRGRQQAFLNDYLPRPLGGQAPLRPFKRVRPQQPRCPPAQPPPPARPAGAPRALGRGLGAVRVLCPAHGAATCAACAATGQGIKYCCSLGHEGHRLAPAAQRAGARALRAWLQAPQQVHRPAPPPQARC